MADTVRALHFSDADTDVENDDEDRGSHRYGVSRLSVLDTKIKHLEEEEEEEEDADRSIMAHMSQLSLQNSSEVDGDEDFDDSDRENGWNEGQERGIGSGNWGSGRRKEAMRAREQWLERVWGMRKKREEEAEGGGEEQDAMMDLESGESECVVIAKPKGGERRLCMDMDEMKACEDLGFELQPEWTLELPRGTSLSSIDTDSGRDSPLANFRISSPG